jgi:di/tricarboxylate transporter
MCLGILPFAGAFSAFSSEIPWLIALAFFLARGFIKTGLGNRIAYYVVSLFGKSTLGLTYSLVFSEAILAPAIPSLAARAGGIFLPLTKALCVACGSNPEQVGTIINGYCSTHHQTHFDGHLLFLE